MGRLKRAAVTYWITMVPISAFVAFLAIAGQSVLAKEDVRVRLVGGAGPWEGRAELYKGREWGSICDIWFVRWGWPSVLCLELGLGQAESARYVKTTERGTGAIAFHSPACTPRTSKSLLTCRQDKKPTCTHVKDVWVKCKGRPTTPQPTTPEPTTPAPTEPPASTTPPTQPPPTTEPLDTCSPIGGVCVEECEYGYKPARKLNKDGKCDNSDGTKRKCCLPSPPTETCSAIGGDCFYDECMEGYKSAKSQGLDGKCAKDANGNKPKCCVRDTKEVKEETCSAVGGTCMEKNGGRCPDGYKSLKTGSCPTNGVKCCIAK